ncbi:hypothetical protein [Kingella kingae]|uniref:hypothetical protein n=1 Tax=Kingella kingae TaxID=504 RepID=UPI0025521E3F|nr:hypothetical protein [Kingella kingae]MDK4624578.1 hypothetical protein [Kingella kingae]MDK4660189.1 hypothetical protein [Kingella kingae]MDK4668173.1 hypothetical protein [Kingella kingae]MDK4686402.1 hypothetical protein [Kingella kingae]
MNIQNQIRINQNINLDDMGLASRHQVGKVYDKLMARLNALSAINEMLADCSSTRLDAGKLYFLFSQQEENLNEVLTDLENLMTK